jgi:hypothetical protein
VLGGPTACQLNDNDDDNDDDDNGGGGNNTYAQSSYEKYSWLAETA